MIISLSFVKHFELPMCMKCAIQINLPCLALPSTNIFKIKYIKINIHKLNRELFLDICTSSIFRIIIENMTKLQLHLNMYITQTKYIQTTCESILYNHISVARAIKNRSACILLSKLNKLTVISLRFFLM